MSLCNKPVLSLKEFLLRKKVLKLYKEVIQVINEVESVDDRKDLKEWARRDFKTNKHHTDEYAIKSLLKYGERSIKELRQNIELSK